MYMNGSYAMMFPFIVFAGVLGGLLIAEQHGFVEFPR